LYQSLAPFIRLYPSVIFILVVSAKKTKKKFLGVQFLLLFDFCSISKNKIKISYFIWLLSKIYQLHQKQKQKSFKKDIYWFLPQKTKQGKIGPNQLGIISNLIL